MAANCGGSYCTIKPTGQGGDYTTLSAWEAGQNAVLAAPELAQIDGDWTGVTDTTAVTINGWTTSAANYIYIYTTSAARHDGKWNTGKYRLEVSSSNNSLYPAEDYIRIEGLQISYDSNSASYWPFYINYTTSAAASDIRFSNSIIRGTLINNGGILESSACTFKAWNNVIYDLDGGYAGIYIGDVASVVYFYNNTIYNVSYGIYKESTPTVTAKNNIVQDSTNSAYVGTFATGSDYNLSDDTSSTGGAHDRTSQTVTFVAAGTDFHLASNDAGARNYGTDLSADANLPFSTDIDGETRPGESVWDIGADEYIAAAGLSIPVAMAYYRQRRN